MIEDDNVRKGVAGRKFRHVRELRGWSQGKLAETTGYTQEEISNIERSAKVGTEALERLSKGLGVTPDYISAFDEELLFKGITNTYNYCTIETVSSKQSGDDIHNHNNLQEVIGLYTDSLEKVIKALTDLVLNKK